jgi:hypothetical protein
VISDYSIMKRRGGPPVWGLGEGLTTHSKKKTCYEIGITGTSDMAGPCEHSDVPSGSMKGGEFLD